MKNNGRHSAPLCAIGYTQVAGLDFQDNFAPVVNDVAFWITILLMMVYGWNTDIVDIKIAFLYGVLDKEILIKVPEGMAEHLGIVFDDNICLVLVQLMYGLIQAAWKYYKKFIKVIVTN